MTEQQRCWNWGTYQNYVAYGTNLTEKRTPHPQKKWPKDPETITQTLNKYNFFWRNSSSWWILRISSFFFLIMGDLQFFSLMGFFPVVLTTATVATPSRDSDWSIKGIWYLLAQKHWQGDFPGFQELKLRRIERAELARNPAGGLGSLLSQSTPSYPSLSFFLEIIVIYALLNAWKQLK